MRRVIIRKSRREIDQMAAAGDVVAQTLELIGEHVQPGVTTRRARPLADEFIRSQDGVPTFMGYRGYPAATCLSPNGMVVHGIPGDYRLAEGDVLSADVGVTLGGFVADSAYTFPVGQISDEAAAPPGRRPRRPRGRASSKSARATGSATSPPPSSA